ncbi:MAG: hypothetical protein ACOY3X_12745 [Pseudomonadota bacterium]
MKRGWQVCAGLVLLAATWPVRADYNDECRGLARQLATDPGALKAGELDLLKSCLSDLQRGVALGNPPAAKSELPLCETPAPAPPAAVPACPVCPAQAPPPACPKLPAAPRERGEDRRLKPYLPTY